MSTARDERVPELTLGWRLQMALAQADVSRMAMAEQLGVDPGTLSRWMHDKGAPPKRAYLMQWAFATSVPVEWLEQGVGPSTPPDGPRERGGLERLTEQKRARTRPIGHREATARYATAA